MQRKYHHAKLLLSLYVYGLIEMLFPELSNPPPPASAVISGSVTNSNAAPDNTVVGVTITAALEDTPSVVSATTVTDTNGNFTLPSLANGTYIITASLANADGSSLGATEDVTIAGADVTAPALALVRTTPLRDQLYMQSETDSITQYCARTTTAVGSPYKGYTMVRLLPRVPDLPCSNGK